MMKKEPPWRLNGSPERDGKYSRQKLQNAISIFPRRRLQLHSYSIYLWTISGKTKTRRLYINTMSIPKNFVVDPDVLEGYAEDVSGERMVPDYLVRPKSSEEVADCLEHCDKEKIAVTPAGQQTNDTASSLAQSGVCLSTEFLKSVVEINADEEYVVVEPGVILGDLKQELKEHNLFYPPDPTSENIASVGGTVATNASGARTYFYGPTHRYVLGLEVGLPGGKLLDVSRVQATKTTTGPAAFSNFTDFWVGSEGILGVFTKIKLRVFRGIPNAYAIMAFFTSMEDLVSFAQSVDRRAHPGVSPRSIEFFDQSCLQLLRDSGKYSMVPQQAIGAIAFEAEYVEEEFEKSLESWLAALEYGKALVDDSIVAETDAKIEELRELRHYVPATLNEYGQRVKGAGGRKVSTDWAVKLDKFPEMLKRSEKLCAEFGFPAERTFRYAHLGDGHPHYNFIPEDTAETEKCLELRRELSKLAVSLGGTVAAEHGIGKHRKDLLALEDRSFSIELLRKLKTELDPNGILSPGNILS